MGRPLPQVEVQIADPVTGETMPVGAVGEICARGYQVMTGYFDMPEETAAAIDGDGWLQPATWPPWTARLPPIGAGSRT